ncbi:uncharacterized protein [Diadema setosum]|uniref:uncharacterized protein n=1 Tax=Diadema setosum TaxID=31175 RepID=UPI003B3BDA5E
MATMACMILIGAILQKSLKHHNQMTRSRRLLAGRHDLLRPKHSKLKLNRTYLYSQPRQNMCFFSGYMEREGMPKLHSVFSDPVSKNVVFIGTRFLAQNWTKEKFVSHFETGESILCDPIVEDYLSFGYLSQFNVVLTCQLPSSLVGKANFSLTLQRISNVKRFQRYAYNDIMVCSSGSSKFKRFMLTACTMIRNMDDFVPEWITFHRYVGVQHFFLYDNESPENSTLRHTVREEIAEGVVTVIPWTHAAVGQKTYLEVQIAHENDCVWRNRYRSKWMLKIDVDEFVQPMNASKRFITDYLEGSLFDRVGAVRLQNWFFGRRDNMSIQSGDSVVERNTWRPSYPTAQNSGRDKNILQPMNIHYFKIHAVKIGAPAVSLSPHLELRLVHYRLDNPRIRRFDFPDFDTRDLSMVKMMAEAKKLYGRGRLSNATHPVG